MLRALGTAPPCTVRVTRCVHLLGASTNIVATDNALRRRIPSIPLGHDSTAAARSTSRGRSNTRSWPNAWRWPYTWRRSRRRSIGSRTIGPRDPCRCSGMNTMLRAVGTTVPCTIWVARRGHLLGTSTHCITKDDTLGSIVSSPTLGNHRRTRWNSVSRRRN